MTANCVCTHTHRSHFADGRCGLCACHKYRRVLECAECGADLGLDCGLGDDEGALCCGCCGTHFHYYPTGCALCGGDRDPNEDMCRECRPFDRERADVRDEAAYEANRDNGFGVL